MTDHVEAADNEVLITRIMQTVEQHGRAHIGTDALACRKALRELLTAAPQPPSGDLLTDHQRAIDKWNEHHRLIVKAQVDRLAQAQPSPAKGEQVTLHAADDAELVRRLLSAEADTSVDLDETYDLLRKAAARITALSAGSAVVASVVESGLLSASRDTAGLVKALEEIERRDTGWVSSFLVKPGDIVLQQDEINCLTRIMGPAGKIARAALASA